MQLVSRACSIFLAVCVVWVSSEEPPVVTTSQGRIIGTRLQFSPSDPALRRSVDAYRGILYAEPPVGPLRFKPPVAKSWSGELQASEVGNHCPQPIDDVNRKITGNSSEDCLSLAVFVPQPVPFKAAVLVFFHGGGFSIVVSPEVILADRMAAVGDVIVVVPNYRLGALGFLSTDDDVIPGNMGLLDQRLALEWVRDNIQAFGGDPNRVAIFGESAGGVSVGLHMVSPGSAGLFRGAIMQSGEASSIWSVVPGHEARERAFALGKLVGCERKTSQELLECLQAVEDFHTFIENQHEKLVRELEEIPVNPLYFIPVVDGTFLPDAPAVLFEEGAINDAVSIAGDNADEGMLVLTAYYPNNTEAPYIDSATYDAISRPWMSTVSTEPIVAEAVKLMYRDASCKDAPVCDYLQSLSQALGDYLFACPIDVTARAFTRAGRKVYRYHMTHAPTTPLFGPKWAKVNHGAGLQFVFGVPLVPSDEYEFTEDEVRMSLQTIEYWANLAKTGNPNLSSLDAELTDKGNTTEWPLFTVEELAYKDLSLAMLNGRGIKARECLMWNEFIPKLVQTAEEAKQFREAAKSSTSGIKNESLHSTLLLSFLLALCFYIPAS